MPYQADRPVLNRLLAQMRDFWRENPDEYLTYDDAKAKWGVSQGALTTAMHILRREGLLDSGTMIYRTAKVPQTTDKA